MAEETKERHLHFWRAQGEGHQKAKQALREALGSTEKLEDWIPAESNCTILSYKNIRFTAKVSIRNMEKVEFQFLIF